MLLIAIWGFGQEGEQAALLDVEPSWDKWALRSKEFAVAVLEYVPHFAKAHSALQLLAERELPVLRDFI